MQENEIPQEDILIVEAEIVPDGLGGWMIRCLNTETNEERYCKTIEEYSAFLNEAVYTTQKDHFKAVWLESPKATPKMIGEVRAKLMEYYNQIEGQS
ncbi:hypothetical protein [Nitratiruptor sp. YY09-18]|uniref:hypothetical protein n=1 Tax=Nitratiruptor sp. YY09-18 TaxID=2724901 RepID=UPI0019150942|nr:hypothetical protein [Nitratiruptor sp. YY09-18]BCD68019.1 hypothetical protein NitYY0918_C0928 [Nitratiruptor sp. YY09-18]